MKWLSLVEYSYKYKVSVDALRKKIRLNQIEYMFVDHEYKVPDKTFFEHYPSHSDEEIKTKLIDYENKSKDLMLKLAKKDQDISQLKADYEDLKNLMQFLERENQELKDILCGIKKIEDWVSENNPN